MPCLHGRLRVGQCPAGCLAALSLEARFHSPRRALRELPKRSACDGLSAKRVSKPPRLPLTTYRLATWTTVTPERLTSGRPGLSRVTVLVIDYDMPPIQLLTACLVTVWRARPFGEFRPCSQTRL